MSNNKNKILTELPRYTEGRYKGKVNCQAMVGMDLELLYDDEVYSVKIVEYVKRGRHPMFKIKYNESIGLIDCDSFINRCNFGGALSEWKEMETNDENKILSKLPFKGNKVNYNNMKGLKIEILYKKQTYHVEIINYIKGSPSKFEIKYNDEIKAISCCKFMIGQFGGILNLKTKDFKYHLGEKVVDNDRDLIIIEKEYRQRVHTDGLSVINDKYYRYKCNRCGWDEGWIVESCLLNGIGCSCCTNRTAVLGVNTIWDTDRWLCDLGVSEEDAKTHTRSSGKKVTITCPDCGKQKFIALYSLAKNKSIGCSCSDKKSYPEKFMMNMLDQLGIKYETQYQPKYLNRLEKDGKWSQKKSDFYLPEYKRILETDGALGHKNGATHSKSKKPLEYYVEVDNWKDEQHLLHGLETTRIDCFKSDMKYIKNNILNSELNKIFDLSKIDWLKCEEFALKNLIKEVCEYWRNKEGWETTTDLEKQFNLDKTTVIKYLKRGTVLGWCNYDPKEEMRKNGLNKGKAVAMYDLEGNFIMKESSIVNLKERCLKELNINLSTRCISGVCLGKCKTHKGYIFKYID